MRGWQGLLIVLALVAIGCQTPPPAADPFLAPRSSAADGADSHRSLRPLTEQLHRRRPPCLAESTRRLVLR